MFIIEFSIKQIHVKSKWFDGSNNKYKKIGYDGFYLYLNLFRFRLHNQPVEYTFLCSLGLIRKEIGYSTQKIFELLKLLVKEKVIKVNLSRWDRLLDDKGKLMDDKVLIIDAIDKPVTYRGLNDKGEEVDLPSEPKEKNYYISLDMPLMQYYMSDGLNERYFGLHCLINKLSNGTEGKCWMSINTMADVLGFGDKTINNMIYELNRKYLLYSRYGKSDRKVISKSGERENGSQFEHFLLSNLDHKEQWLAANKDMIDRNVRKWDKKDKNKSKEECAE